MWISYESQDLYVVVLDVFMKLFLPPVFARIRLHAMLVIFLLTDWSSSDQSRKMQVALMILCEAQAVFFS